jgi:hypothetical protein
VDMENYFRKGHVILEAPRCGHVGSDYTGPYTELQLRKPPSSGDFISSKMPYRISHAFSLMILKFVKT